MHPHDPSETTASQKLVSALSREKPDYRDMSPLPQAVLAKFEPFVLDYKARRKSPLVLRKFEDGTIIRSRRLFALEWLCRLGGVFAPAQVTRLSAAVCPDDNFSPKLPQVHFRELTAGLWNSATFPRLFEGHSSEWHLYVSVSLEDGDVSVAPSVRLARVGPEIVTGPLVGLDFVDEATKTVEEHWIRFCHESRYWLAASGIAKLALKGTTTAIPRSARS